MKYAFIGSGSMARAIMGGMTRAGVPGGDVSVINPGNPVSAGEAAAMCGVTAASPEALRTADMIVVAVKPQSFPGAAPFYRELIPAGALVVTIMAGVSASDVASALGASRVVRVMPNLAMSVGKGAAGIAPGPGANEADMDAVAGVFGASGVVARIAESEINDVTALSGSGAAYIYYLTEALRDAAIAEGMAPEKAGALARQTLIGAAAQLEAENEAPEELRRRITSKKGTTEAAVNALRDAGLPGAVLSAFRANKRRSEELARGE